MLRKLVVFAITSGLAAKLLRKYTQRNRTTNMSRGSTSTTNS
ncbi:MAG: hypothetical protein V4731_00255 [Pseudomonadota bacterium]